MLICDQYLLPKALDEALELWSHAPEGSRIIAGATDTLPWARQGRAGDIAGDVHIPALIDISQIPELSGYEELGNGRLRLGANLVLQQFLEDPVLRRHLPSMPYCAVWFADDQIRQQATIAGNIVNASPAADGTPPLMLHDANIELARLQDENIDRRTISIEQFVTGPGTTALASGELVTGIECASLAGYGGAFEKVGQRRSLVISTVCAACCIRTNDTGDVFEDVRLALGGIGPVPIRARDVEAFLRGKMISHDTIKAAALMPTDRIKSRTRRGYRRDVVRGFVQRAIEDALADIGLSVPAIGPAKELQHV